MKTIPNIATHCAKTDIKPELAMVYVHTRDGIKYAVATDSYRLAEINLSAIDNMAVEFIKDGYYTAKQWQQIVSISNKKKIDLYALETLLAGIMAVQDRYKSYKYPDYTQVIPKEDTLETVKLDNIQLNREYFIDMMELIPLDIFDILKMDNFKQKKDAPKTPIIHKSEVITLLIMPCNK